MSPNRSSVAATVTRAFAPIHKRALGLAVGITSGLVIAIATGVQVLAHPADGLPLYLLSEYFYGYDVSWVGAIVGAWWGFVAGFAAGWFLAFCRNFVVATWILVVRAKASLRETSDFLDHI